MKIFPSFSSLLSPLFVFSQPAPSIEWQNTIGSEDYDFLASMSKSNDGGYFLGGHSAGSSGDKSEASLGSYDYWIVKIDNEGNIEWQNTVGSPDYDELKSVEATTDGGVLLGGWSLGGIGGDKTEANFGFEDYWIVKLDSEGNVEWDNTIGTSTNDYLYASKQVTDGGYILAGYTYGGISFDKTEANYGSFDYWIVRLDNAGNIIWQNDIGSFGADELYSIDITNDGGFILGGTTAGTSASGDRTENTWGWTDYWILKLDSSGNIEWQNLIGGTNAEQYPSIVQISNGEYVLGGESFSGLSGDKTEENIGVSDYWVIRLDASGNIIWQNTLGGSDADELNSVEPVSDGGFILAGNSYSGISGDKSEESLGALDYWVVKLDHNGNLIWENTIGGKKNDKLFTAQQTGDNGFILCGYSESGANGDKTESKIGYFDYWIVKLFPDIAPCETAPTGLFATNITTNKAKLHWAADAEAVKYKVQYRASSASAWTTFNATTNVKTITGLSANTAYEYRIRSQCSGGLSSPWSSIETFTTLPLKEISNEFSLMSVYPNPSNGNFTVQFPELQDAGGTYIFIKNIVGEEVYADKIDISSAIQKEIILNKNIPEGMYIVNIKTNDRIVSQKILISK